MTARRGRPRLTLTPDAERVLGQIARGEVLAGPEAARQIAARHEAAYGAAFTRPATNHTTQGDPS